MKNFLITIIMLCLVISVSNAQVTIDIGNNLLVETTGGVYISGASDVIENTSGYLKGVVESSSLSGATSFAGLTFSCGFTGSIKRTTGTQYTGNGAGTNCLRNYQLNNTGTAISPNISSTLVATGTNDESNTMNGPFFLYTYDTDWTGNGDGSTGGTVSANGVSIGTGVTDLVISEGTGIAAKIYLDGPYNSTANNMNTTLNAQIPLTSPYSEDPRSVSAVPATAVDWVLVQLRDQTTPATVIESRSAFINADGNVIEDDGTAGIGIKSAPGDYYIVVKHRNHLGVMTSSVQTGLTWGN